MKTIEIDGQLYTIYEWVKPEDSDFGIGELCYAVYPMKYSAAPVLCMCSGNKMFRPMYVDNIDCQPLFVLKIPSICDEAIGLLMLPDVCNMVGDSRDETDRV